MFVGASFSQYKSYLKSSKLLRRSIDEKGSCPNKTMAAFGLQIRLYSFHKSSNGIIISQAHLVVPYGKSHKTISTEWSFKVFIISKQSPL